MLASAGELDAEARCSAVSFSPVSGGRTESPADSNHQHRGLPLRRVLARRRRGLRAPVRNSQGRVPGHRSGPRDPFRCLPVGTASGRARAPQKREPLPDVHGAFPRHGVHEGLRREDCLRQRGIPLPGRGQPGGSAGANQRGGVRPGLWRQDQRGRPSGARIRNRRAHRRGLGRTVVDHVQVCGGSAGGPAPRGGRHHRHEPPSGCGRGAGPIPGAPPGRPGWHLGPHLVRGLRELRASQLEPRLRAVCPSEQPPGGEGRNATGGPLSRGLPTRPGVGWILPQGPVGGSVLHGIPPLHGRPAPPSGDQPAVPGRPAHRHLGLREGHYRPQPRRVRASGERGALPRALPAGGGLHPHHRSERSERRRHRGCQRGRLSDPRGGARGAGWSARGKPR